MRLRRPAIVAVAMGVSALIGAAGAMADATQRVANGGFETGAADTAAPWAFTGQSAACVSPCDGPAAAGARYGVSSSSPQNVPNGLVVIGTISQTVSVPEGPATLTFQHREVNAESVDASALLTVELGGSILLNRVSASGSTFGQRTVSVPQAQIGPGNKLLRFTFECANSSGGPQPCHRQDIDEVSLVTGNPPDPPTLLGTDPASPANNNDPRVRGNLGAGGPTEVKIFANPTCAGTPAAVGSPTDFATTGITVSVADNSTTSFSARQTNLAGDSTCSNSITYVEDSSGSGNPPQDSQAPETTIASGPKKKTFKKKAKFEFTADDPSARFECSLDRADFVGCAARTTYKVKPGRHLLSVRAVDAAGNADGSPATYRWKYKKKPKRK